MSKTNGNSEETAPYKWPENLYVEARDMAAASFLVYSFGYILDAGRRSSGLDGLDFTESGQFVPPGSDQGFQPEEVEELIEKNKEKLARRYSSTFEHNIELLKHSLEGMKKRNEKRGSKTLALLRFDDTHQTEEMVWAVAKDEINKRITLVFRGTDNALAFGTNWATNLSVTKNEVKLPGDLKDMGLKFDSVRLHSGFHDYIFGETVTDKDAPGYRKVDEIMAAIKPLLAENPDYKLYVTGHSLGGALSAMMSFFLAADPDIPKPVSCISFASPRIGNDNYLDATQAMEKAGMLRFCRFINDKDTVAMIPTLNYVHAGFQVRLFKKNWRGNVKDPEIDYPNPKSGFFSRLGRAWDNNIISGLNPGYDHGDYRERLELCKEFLEKKNLNEMYANSDLTGF